MDTSISEAEHGLKALDESSIFSSVVGTLSYKLSALTESVSLFVAENEACG